MPLLTHAPDGAPSPLTRFLPPLECAAPIFAPRLADKEVLAFFPIFAKTLKNHFSEFPAQKPGAPGQRLLAALEASDAGAAQGLIRSKSGALHLAGLSESSFRAITRAGVDRCVARRGVAPGEAAPRAGWAFDFRAFFAFAQALRAMGLGPVACASPNLAPGRALTGAVARLLGEEAARLGELGETHALRGRRAGGEDTRKLMRATPPASQPQEEPWRGAWMAAGVAGALASECGERLDHDFEFDAFAPPFPYDPATQLPSGETMEEWVMGRIAQAAAAEEAEQLRAEIGALGRGAAEAGQPAAEAFAEPALRRSMRL